MFALNFAKATKRPQLLLCEGYMDAIAVHQAGFDNAVATLGTALTSEQARLMSQYTGEVVIAYDADAAGQKATARATEILSQTGMKLRVLSMKGAKDPDEYIRTQGVARFSQLIEGSANATEFAVSRLREHFDLDTDDGKVGFLREFCALAAALPSPIEADIYITRLAGELGVSREAISAQTTSLRKKRMRERAKKIERTPKIYAQDIPNQPRDIQRSQNMRYALAEDKLIAILLRNPDYYDQIAAAITPAQFVTDSNRTILEALFRRLSSGGDAGLMSLSGEMTPDQMSHLAHLMNSGTQGNTLREAQDCIAVILEKAAQKTDEQVGMMDAQELMNFVSGIAAKKK
ncbi:MAG: toprim domain-containing protein [Oscillospiraceae bacterium]